MTEAEEEMVKHIADETDFGKREKVYELQDKQCVLNIITLLLFEKEKEEVKAEDKTNLTEEQIPEEQKKKGLKFNKKTMEFMQNTFDCGKGYEFLNKQLRIVLSNDDHQVREKLREEDKGKQLQFMDFHSFVEIKYSEAVHNVEHLMFVAGEPSTVIKSKCI